jgi:hypothetical protein
MLLSSAFALLLISTSVREMDLSILGRNNMNSWIKEGARIAQSV